MQSEQRKRHTFLPVIGPVSVHKPKVKFAQAGHEWDLPEDGLEPGAGGLDLEVTEVGVVR